MDAAHLDGAKLGLIWALPFAGMLLSIALLPLWTPIFWLRHFGKVAGFWALVTILPMVVLHGPGIALFEMLHVGLLDYLPFIALLAALFAVTGGIHIDGRIGGTPARNTAALAAGTALASAMGTTGAAMLLTRPLMRANRDRPYYVHVFIFAIFLIANLGGALTPLGDPPLFLGFLNGVDFFWTLRHVWLPTLFGAIVLLALFFVIDTVIARRQGEEFATEAGGSGLKVDGKLNLALLAAVVVIVLVSGKLDLGPGITVFHVAVTGTDIARVVALLAVVGLSQILTPPAIHEANEYNWHPMIEVAKLFAGIFVTMVPALAMLRAGPSGATAPLHALLTHPDGSDVVPVYFWLTGLLSSFLDNAPTYLVFFNAAGGDAAQLMTTKAATLTAISAGSVYMGANSYIGNAPNFMVKAIVESHGLRMPSFIGYMLWSGAILVPLFLVMTPLFFR